VSDETYGPTITPGALALRIAQDHVGVKETPPGSNRGPKVDDYLRSAGLDPEGGSYPWCAAFVTFIVREVEKRLGKLQFAGSASVASLLKRNRSLEIHAPCEGCVFIHLRDDGKGHCGFVTRVNGDWSMATIEGNTDSSGSRTGGQVMHQHRASGYATTFLRVG